MNHPEWVDHLIARYRDVREPPEQIGEGRARLGLYPRQGEVLVGADRLDEDMEESLRRAQDFVYGCYLADEAFRQ